MTFICFITLICSLVLVLASRPSTLDGVIFVECRWNYDCFWETVYDA